MFISILSCQPSGKLGGRVNTCYSSLLASPLLLARHSPATLSFSWFLWACEAVPKCRAFCRALSSAWYAFSCYIFLADFSGLNLNDSSTSLTLHPPPHSLYCMFLFYMLSHSTLLFSPFVILCLFGWLFNAISYHTEGQEEFLFDSPLLPQHLAACLAYGCSWLFNE